MGDQSAYEITSVGRACEIIKILQTSQSRLRMHEIAELAKLNRATTFRILATLQTHGILIKSANATYDLASRTEQKSRYRIGYAAQSSEFAFSRAVTRGILEAAKNRNVDLILTNNEYSPAKALTNADMLLSEDIDLLIEFQTDAQVAPLISATAFKKKVPLIAIEIPHPDAIYFGVNNCQAGLTAGRALGRWAEHHWKGRIDEVILVGLPQAGALPEARLTGTLLGIREVLPTLMTSTITTLNGNGQHGASHAAVRTYLRTCKSRRILVSAINDPSALGALAAFEEAGRTSECAIVGQNGSIEARRELRKASSPLIGSVGYFPEQYGDQVIALATSILDKRDKISRSVFIKHQLLTHLNLRQHYKRESSSDA